MENEMGDVERPPSQLQWRDYTVGWICALPKEQTAATAMLDRIHADLPKPHNDPNTYTLGSIGKHNIVVACLPKGRIGTNSAATSATQMVRTFPSIKVGLMVGIGGGVPTKTRLGDVVISAPVDQYPGVVQWDLGKTGEGGEFRRIGAQNSPPNALLTALTKMESRSQLIESRMPGYLKEMERRWPNLTPKYTHPPMAHERNTTPMKSPEGGQGWRISQLWEALLAVLFLLLGWQQLGITQYDKQRDASGQHQTKAEDTRVHYGLIASGNQVIKDAKLRDLIDENLGGNVLCVEMEAAGLMNIFPCIIIRGICDYADSKKSKEWQEYAAGVAAACAKELLEYVHPSDVDEEQPIKEILADVMAAVNRTDANVKALRSRSGKEEDLKILDWLTHIDYGPQHSDFLKNRQPGTGQWFLESDEYQNWRSSSTSTLFCPGVPGAGKTIIAATVIDDLSAEFLHDQSIGIAYIYCNFHRKHDQKLEDLLQALVKQLSQSWPSSPAHINDLYEKHHNTKTRPSADELSKALLETAAMYSRVFIVVDALDECQTDDGTLSKFLSNIFSLQAKSAVSFLATSRPIPDIEKWFDGCPSHEILASDGDIRNYLNGHMTRLPGFVFDSPPLQEEIKAEIITAVDGIFLLARLHLDSLVGMRAPKAIRTALKQLPQGSNAYDSAYDQAMEKIRGQVPSSRELAQQTLAWITCAKRQLTVLELQHALAVEVGQPDLDEDNISQVADILSVCAGLVTVDEESDTIRLVHYTTQEYFTRTRHHWFPDAETAITKACVSYISFGAFESGICGDKDQLRSRLDTYRFYKYSACNWGHHARGVPKPCPEVISFLKCNSEVNASFQALLENEFRHSQALWTCASSGLHLAAIFGLEKAAEATIQEVDVNILDSFDRTALVLAAKHGRIGVINRLLEAGADIESKTDCSSQAPLSWAAMHGHAEVVKQLLNHGADIETTDYRNRTPLSFAAEGGHGSVVKELLDQGAGLEIVDDKHGRAPISWAAVNGHTAIVKQLLDGGANIETENDIYPTPLIWAAMAGQTATVRELLDRGANIEHCWDHAPAIYYAGSRGHDMTVGELLRRGANVDPRDWSGRTPLLLAAMHGHMAVVKQLLDAGADPNAKDKSGLSPAYHAALDRQDAVVEELLIRGADPHEDLPYRDEIVKSSSIFEVNSTE